MFSNGTKNSTYFHTQHHEDVREISSMMNKRGMAGFARLSKAHESNDPLMIPKAIGDKYQKNPSFINRSAIQVRLSEFFCYFNFI